MPRPSMVRADTLDLQDHEEPSAQSHPPHPTENSAGLAPHQSQAIRNVVDEQVQHGVVNGNGLTHTQMGKQEEAELERELADTEATGEDGDFDPEMDKMSSSPSIADEDIDFEMVYALHTFTATVEGQANASKGEHMVLLDDSNSYWWLVRIVRDNSIGYLPAEHIETPTERLARLNKHRNIDLASNMLGDHEHKSKNPLKKAMKRRNAKNVAFGPPSYIEASDYEDTDEEEEEGEEGFFGDEEGEKAEGQTAVEEEQESESQATNGTTNGNSKDEENNGVKSEPVSTTEGVVRMRPNPTPSSLRHPDSAIFNDENKETKKLTLTPNLLRDDGISGSPTKEIIKGRSSLDKGERSRADSVTSPPLKDPKKLKKGGGSVLGGLFKRRSKKGRRGEEDEDVDDWLHGGDQKQSIDSNRSIDSVSKDSASIKSEEHKKDKEEKDAAQRQKETEERLEQQRLQDEREAQRRMKERQAELRERERIEQQRKRAEAQRAATQAGAGNSTIRRVPPEEDELETTPEEPQPKPEVKPEPQHEKQTLKVDTQNGNAAVRGPDRSPTDRSPTNKSPSIRSPMDNKSPADQNLQAAPRTVQPRTRSPSVPSPINAESPKAYSPRIYEPPKVYRRPSEDEIAQRQLAHQQAQQQAQQIAPALAPVLQSPTTVSPSPLSISTPVSAHDLPDPNGRLSESPEHINYNDVISDHPDLVVDTSSGGESGDSMDSSPEIIERSSTTDSSNPVDTLSPTSDAPSQPSIARTWSDWSLRTYFDDDNDVRDMLIVVHRDREQEDGKDHPSILPLYAESSKKLADLNKRLDGMLGTWMKSRNRG